MSGWSSLRIKTRARRPSASQPEPSAVPARSVLADVHPLDIPHRMEAYDISNLAGMDIVASMVVFQDGRPLKSAYKRFRVEGLTDQDDYASMHQVCGGITSVIAGFSERRIR